MILAIIWLATKICQHFIFDLAKSITTFLPNFGLPNLWHDKFWLQTNQALINQLGRGYRQSFSPPKSLAETCMTQQWSVEFLCEWKSDARLALNSCG